MFCKSLYKLYILQVYLKNIKQNWLKYKNFLVWQNIKSRLCFYINLDFLQFHFISSKIHISQVYLKHIKSYTSKDKNFLFKLYFKINILFFCVILFIFLFRSYGWFFLVYLRNTEYRYKQYTAGNPDFSSNWYIIA